MSQSKYFKERLIEEFEYNIKKISECNNPEEGLFYLSAIPAVLSRIINFEFDEHLLFIQFVLRNVQQQISRASQVSRGPTPMIDIDLFYKLSDLLKEMMITIKENNDTYKIIEKIIVLVYTTTGNGYYLKERGIIKF